MPLFQFLQHEISIPGQLFSLCLVVPCGELHDMGNERAGQQ